MRHNTIVILVVGFLVPFLAHAQEGDQDRRVMEVAIAAALEKAAPWTVKIEALGGTRAGSGSVFDDKGGATKFNPALDAATTGIIMSEDGIIVTSTFNLESNPRILTVMLHDGREFTAQILGRDNTRMLAVLKIDVEGLPVPEVVPTASIEPGIRALALGRTFSDAGEGPSVNLGILSAKGRHGGKALQTDASSNPSNYGGPLVDIQGRAMGIMVPFSDKGTKAGVGFYDSGIGFAIPLEDVKRLLPRVIAGGSLNPGFLGIRADTEFKGPGVKVSEVIDGTCAKEGGIEAGDVILQVDGQEVKELRQLQSALSKKFAGDSVQVTLQRGEEEIELEFELGTRPG